jgi:hypothetical protein
VLTTAETQGRDGTDRLYQDSPLVISDAANIEVKDAGTLLLPVRRDMLAETGGDDPSDGEDRPDSRASVV